MGSCDCAPPKQTRVLINWHRWIQRSTHTHLWATIKMRLRVPSCTAAESDLSAASHSSSLMCVRMYIMISEKEETCGQKKEERGKMQRKIMIYNIIHKNIVYTPVCARMCIQKYTREKRNMLQVIHIHTYYVLRITQDNNTHTHTHTHTSGRRESYILEIM